jgi:hypothetical protein
MKIAIASLCAIFGLATLSSAQSVIAPPTTVTASSEFSGDFAVTKLFDAPVTNADIGATPFGPEGQYAGNGLGPHSVYMDYGSDISTGGFAFSQRIGFGATDKLTEIRFYFSATDLTGTDLTTLTPDETVFLSNTIDTTLTLELFTAEYTNRYVAMYLVGNGPNPGGSEFRLVTDVDPLLLQDAKLTFPSIDPSATATDFVTLDNGGVTQSLTITNATITGPNAANFSIVGGFPASIPASSSGNIEIEFDPSGTVGGFSATLEVTSNSGGVPGTVTTTTLSGVAGGSGASLLPAPATVTASSEFSAAFAVTELFDASPTESDIGVTAFGGEGQYAGAGLGPHSVYMDFGADITADGFAYSQRLGLDSAFDKVTQIRFFFSATDLTGTDLTTLTPDETISLSNTTDSIFTLELFTAPRTSRYVAMYLTGNAGNPGGSEFRFVELLEPLLVAPVDYDFAETTISAPIQETISIANGGLTQTLNIASVTPVGGDAANFTVDNFPASLAAGASGDITVTFNPMGDSGDYTTTLEISSDEGGTPGTITTITLHATVFPDPFLFLDPASLVFPSTASNATATDFVFLYNEGLTQELVITSATITGPDADKFSIVGGFPSSIPAIDSASIEIEFNPSGATGSFSATLEVTSNDNGVPGTVTTTALSGVGGTLTNQPLSNATGGLPWSGVDASNPADLLSDPFAFDPNMPTSIAPDQTWPTGLFLTQNNDAQNYWECDIDLSNGATLQFLDVWGRSDIGAEVVRHRDLIITLSNGVDSWSSAPWNGVSNTPTSYGRFNFTTAGVTPASLLQNATFLSIDHSPGSGEFLLLAEVRASGIGGTTSSTFDTWASGQGLDGSPGKEDGPTDDPDVGGFSNLGEFGLGGDPLDPSDDGALTHVFSADLVGGAEPEGILTILVRSGATFSPSGNDQVATIDGITYTVIGDNTLPLASGAAVTATTPVTTDLPAAPDDYEYASFYISGSKGFFQVTVVEAP